MLGSRKNFGENRTSKLIAIAILLQRENLLEIDDIEKSVINLK